MLTSKLDIDNYIPQRAPIVMVDSLIEASESHAVSRFFVEQSNIFVVEGKFTEAGMIENIAQTAALHAGYWCRKMGTDVKPGFIAAIKDLKVSLKPALETTIVTEVRITNRVLDVAIIRGEIRQQDRTICSCELRVFVKEK